jgi:inorganic phosphate transporter, PiT family
MPFLLLSVLLAVYLAWNLGANDVANSMGTSVGSKAITLRQAVVIAGVLEFVGAVGLGQRVSQTLATQVVDPAQFSATPQVLVMGMMAVLVACGLWMNVATLRGLPVSSSHAIVGAIAGFASVALGPQAIHWGTLGTISATWMLTPLVSGAIAATYFWGVQRWILAPADAAQRLVEWVPWLSALLVGSVGGLVLPALAHASWSAAWPGSSVQISLGVGAIAIVAVARHSWPQVPYPPAGPPFSQPSSPPSSPPSGQDLTTLPFARLQVASACCVALAHGSNDVGNAIAPLAVIVHVLAHGTSPTNGVEIPLWILVLGGGGIVGGLAVWGKTVIQTIGEGIIPLHPSGGFCAELATATTVLMASQVGLPVSTSHALVGAVVGLGLVQARSASPELRIQWHTVAAIAQAWLVTIPISAALSAGLFWIMRSMPSRW